MLPIVYVTSLPATAVGILLRKHSGSHAIRPHVVVWQLRTVQAGEVGPNA